MPSVVVTGANERHEAALGYRAYLVRVWRSGGTARVSAQDVATGSCRTFPSVAALCSWLADDLCAPPPPDPVSGDPDPLRAGGATDAGAPRQPRR